MNEKYIIKAIAFDLLIFCLKIALIGAIVFGCVYLIGWTAEALAHSIPLWAVFSAFIIILFGVLFGAIRR